MVNLEDLYDRYADWEEEAWGDEVTKGIEWVRQYYRDSFRLLTEPEFRNWWFRMDDWKREFHLRRWTMGNRGWLEEKHRENESGTGAYSPSARSQS